MYQVEFVSMRVQKEFAAFDQGNQKQIKKAILELSVNPKPVHLGFQALCSNGKVKRIKLGRIRMFYQIDEKNQKVWIGKLDSRDSSTYRVCSESWFRNTA
jgi:mRNA-degrading endonuclease RelE of RelBE toxin-antitoxin system